MKRQWNDLRIGEEEHAFICGQTGSGKTVLAEYLVNDPRVPFSVVYDPKHSRSISEWKGQTFIYRFEDLDSHEAAEIRRIVYRPPLEEVESREGQLRFFKWIYEQGSVRLYVDECSALLGDSSPNVYFKGVLTRGRELGISAVCGTQRPVSIPLITLTEASWFFVFRENLPEDRSRIEKVTGISDVEQASLRRYEFFVWNVFRGNLGKFKLKLNGGTER
jgi:hypothetical protein